MSKRGKQKKYSKELKLQAIHSYLNGEGSLKLLAKNMELFIWSNSDAGFCGIMVIKK